MDIGQETVGDYLVKGKKIDIEGCWYSGTPVGEYDFYDLYDEEGNCLNEGDPWFSFPKWKEVKKYLEENYT